MIVLDANILLYAYNDQAPEQRAVATWLENLLEGPEIVGLPWLSLWAFLRLSTSARVYTNPKSPQEAFGVVKELLSLPGVSTLGPGPLHVGLLEHLVVQRKAVGPLVSDAALAAIALENGATLATADGDFRRFAGLKTVNPLDDSTVGGH